MMSGSDCQRYESGTNVTYTCEGCYTGGGISTCQCEKWSNVTECSGKFTINAIQQYHEFCEGIYKFIS